MTKDFLKLKQGDKLYLFNTNRLHFYSNDIVAIERDKGLIKIYTGEHIFKTNVAYNDVTTFKTYTSDMYNETVEEIIIVATSLKAMSDELFIMRKNKQREAKVIDAILNDIENNI